MGWDGDGMGWMGYIISTSLEVGLNTATLASLAPRNYMREMRSKKLQKFSAVSMKCLKIGNKFFEMKKITLEAYFVKFRICLSVLPFWNSPLKKLCRVEISGV